MTMSLNQGTTARIYQFPAGGRSVLGGRRTDASKATTDLAAPRIPDVNCSGSWYHQAAIDEAKPAWER